MNNLKKTFFIGTIFTLLLFLVHAFISYVIPLNTKTVFLFKILRPTRDMLFFPFMLIANNSTEIYCWLAKIGILDFERCILPTGKGLNMIEGEPAWFEWITFIVSIALMILFYTFLLKIIFFLKNRFHPSHLI